MLRIISWIYEQPFKPYRRMAEILKESIIKQGYEFTLYPANEEDVGACLIKGKLYIKCQGRPKLIRKALDEHIEDLAWMDLDCIIKEPLGDVLNDCDAAFTLRSIDERNSNHLGIFKYLNCGVMFFKNNEAARRLIDLWENNIREDDLIGSDDQTALNNLLLKYSLLEKYNEIIDVDGIKVKILDSRIYNFFYFPEDSSEAKILHYKGFSFKKEGIYEHCTAA